MSNKKETRYSFEVDGEKYCIPHPKDLPGGWFHYSAKLSQAAEKKDNGKVLQYQAKMTDFMFGIETDAQDAWLSLTTEQQQAHLKEWQTLETELNQVDSGK